MHEAPMPNSAAVNGGLPDACRLPFQRARGLEGSGDARAIALVLDGEVGGRLAALATAHSVAPAAVYLAAWAIWLHRLSEQADVAIRVAPMAAPGHGVPVAIAVGGSRVSEVLARAQAAWRLAQHPAAAEAPRGTAGFAYGAEPASGTLGDLQLTVRTEDAQTHPVLHHDPQAFAPQVAERFAEGLAALLADMAAQGDVPVDRLAVVGPRERQRLLHDGAALLTESDITAVHRTIEARAARSPEAIALVSDGTAWPYAALNERANRLARHMQAQGVGPGTVVGLHLGRTADMPIAMLAVVKTGAAYLAVETSLPEARAAQLMASVGRPVLLAGTRPAPALAAQAAGVVVLDELADALAAQSGENLALEVPPTAIAAIYMTSGTSGEPKPVVYTHEALARATRASLEAYGFTPEANFLYVAPYAFVASLMIFVGLSAGMRLTLASLEVATSPLATFELVRAAGITHMFMVPTFWRASMQAIDTLPPDTRAALLDNRLQVFITGGEAVQSDVVNLWRERFGPNTRVLNGYGQTETMSVCTHEVPPGTSTGGTVPVGRPIRGCAVYLLDEHLAPVPMGASGMIFARSAHMAKGYLGRTDAPDEKMVANPFGPGRLCMTGDLGRFDEDGNLCVLGRLDQMLKIRGQRIEPGEIEMQLRAHQAVLEAAVVGRATHTGAFGLVAFLVTRPDQQRPTPAELGVFLSRSLTSAMVPSAYVFVPALPTNTNGKVDLATLRTMPFEAAPTGSERVAPRDDQEARLFAMWADVLGFDDFGVTDSFFDLGGDSLRAIHMMARVERELDYRVPVTVFVQSPTIAGLALAIARGETDQADAHIVPLRAGGSLPPLIWLPPIGGSPETYMGIARLLPADQPVYAGYLVRATRDEDFNLSLPQWAKVYADELHRRFPQGPLRIAGYSSGAGVALEVVRQLEALGHPIEYLIALDTDISQQGRVAAAPAPVAAWRANARLVLRGWQLGYGYRHPNALAGLLGLKNRLLGAPAAQAPAAQAPATPELAPSAAQALPVAFAAMPPLPLAEVLHRLERAQPALLPGGRKAMRGLLWRLPRLPVESRRAALFAFLDAHTPPSESLAPLGLPEAHRRRVTRSSYVLREAYDLYRPAGPIAARVILLKTDDAGHGAEDLGWGRVAPRGVTCVDVPGDHRSMMYPPHLDVTAARLWEAMGRPTPVETGR